MTKVITSHSNYVLRRKVQATSLGTIFERDWMTVSEMDGFAPVLLPVYQSGNFKIAVNGEVSPRKHYSYGNWVKNGEDEFWTLENTDATEVKVDRTILKPNYSSLLDFAYYGSAKELVNASVTDIIKKFPAEVYLSDSNYKYVRGNEFVKVVYYGDENGLAEGEKELYLVENPFNIDFGSVYVEPSKVENEDRYICLSADKYEVIYHEGEIDERRFGLCWDVDNRNVRCTGIDSSKYIVVEDVESVENPDGAKFYLVKKEETSGYTTYDKYVYMDDEWEGAGEYYLYDYTVLYTANLGFTTLYGLNVRGEELIFHDGSCTGFHIRPKDEYVEEAFEKMDDFERAILNRDSKPTYKITLETPRETEKGVVATMEDYVWPVIHNWNLDIDGAMYQTYLGNLIRIADYYDEYRSDNICRSYTHETIKTFDWTSVYEFEQPEIDGIPIETEYMTNILRIYGRQFDDLKRYIENIKSTTNISYNEKNNIPDNILAKMLEYDGWEVKDVSPLDSNTMGVEVDYPGENKFATSEDANIEFMKRLALNSRSILSRKGTIAGLKMMYSLFGIPELGSERHSYGGSTTYETGYTISEYDVLATVFPHGEDIEAIENLNEKKDDFYSQYKLTQNTLVGLMVDRVSVGDASGNEVEYLVPWYDKTQAYDSAPYFQMFGGWGKREWHGIEFSLTPEITRVGGNDTIYEFGIYDETVKSVNVVNYSYELSTLQSTLVFDGVVFYAIDITSYLNNNTRVADDEVSHYFVCRPKGYTTERPVVEYDNDFEWVPVFYNDFALDEDEADFARNAARVLYAESINNVAKGNDPHNGKTVYDDGTEYFNFFQKIFHSSEKNDEYFSQYRAELAEQNSVIVYKNRFVNPENPISLLGDITSGATDYGFGVFDGDEMNLIEDNRKIWFFVREGETRSGSLYKREGGLEEWDLADMEKDLSFEKQGPGTTFNPYKIDDLSRGNNSELSSYSVLNSKKLVITYHLSEQYRDYVTNVVEFYIKQIIPSTTILEFVWETTESTETGTCRSEIFAMAGDDPLVFGVISDDEQNSGSSLSLSPSSRRVGSKATKAKFSIGSKNVNKNTIGLV